MENLQSDLDDVAAARQGLEYEQADVEQMRQEFIKKQESRA